MYREVGQLKINSQSVEAAEALLRYERIGAQTGWSNGLLAYNAANAHLRLGDVGRAVLYYQRAADLISDDRDVRQGLAYARRLRTDQFDHPVLSG